MNPVVKNILTIILGIIALFLSGLLNNQDLSFNTHQIITLGFLILISYALGEFFASVKLPKIGGYLLSGIIFGPYVFNNTLLSFISKESLNNLDFIHQITLSIIAMMIGLEVKFVSLKKSIKPALIAISFKLISLAVLIFSSLYLLSFLSTGISIFNSNSILITGIIFTLLFLSTSLEVSSGIIKETEIKNSFTNFLIDTTLIKNVLIVLLTSLLSLIVGISSSSDSILNINSLSLIFYKFILSLLIGCGIGIAGILFIKFIKKELLIFILITCISGCLISNALNLENLILFLTAGIIISNFSRYEEVFLHPLNKISQPVFIIFFTLIAASLKFEMFHNFIPYVILFSIIRIIAFWVSLKFALKISGYPLIKQNYSGFAFLPIGIIVLGIGNISNLNSIVNLEYLNSIIVSFIGINIFIGILLQRYALNKTISPNNETEESSVKEKSELVLENKDSKLLKKMAKFKEPNFQDQRINSILYGLLVKINSILTNFERKFIAKRTEESLELLITLSEKYSDDYQKLKDLFTSEKKSINEINITLLTIKKELVVSYLKIFQERAHAEKEILKLEELIKNLFYSLSDITLSIPETIDIEIENSKLKINKGNSLRQLIIKFFYRVILFTTRLFNKKYTIKRKLDLRNLFRYFLIGTSSKEILETVNLVGLERLNTLKQLKRLFLDYCNYLDELLDFAINEKDNVALNLLIMEKSEEVHKEFVNELQVYMREVSNSTNEISSRLNYAIATPYNRLIETLESVYDKEFVKLKYKYSKVFEQSEKDKENTFESIRFWVNYYLGVLGLAKKDGNIQLVRTQLNLITHTSFLSISEEINSNLRGLITSLLKVIKSISKDINNLSDNPDAVKEIISTKLKNGLLDVIDEHLSALETTRKSKTLNSIIEDVLKDLKRISLNLPEKIYIVPENELTFVDRKPVYKELRGIEFRDFVSAFIEKNLPKELGEITELLLSHLNFTSLELKNIYSMISYHINTLIEELSSTNLNRNKIALEIMESLQSKLNNRFSIIKNQIDTLEKNIHTDIIEKVEKSIESIVSITTKDNKKTDQFIETQRKQIINITHNIFYSSKYTLRKSFLLTKKFLSKLSRPILRILFRELYENEIIQYKPANFNIVKIDEQLKKLPFIYRKVFDGSQIESGNLMFDNPEVLKNFSTAVNNFFENKKTSILICGEPGSGKSSFINNIKIKTLKDVEYVNYQFKNTVTTRDELLEIISIFLGLARTASLEEIVLMLNDKANKKIILIENTGKLFLRSVNGYEAIKTFIYLINQTSKNTLWICSISKQPFDFLKYNFHFDDYFDYKVFTHELYANNLKKIILNRHDTTGYFLNYLPDEIITLREKILGDYKSDSKKQIYEQQYFKKLLSFSQGNITAGMFYWLYSIQEFENETITIKSPERYFIGCLNNLTDRHMLALSSILTHSWLTDNELSLILNISLEDSKEILGTLVNSNLIYLDQLEVKSNKYFINKFFYRIIINELTIRNIIIK